MTCKHNWCITDLKNVDILTSEVFYTFVCSECGNLKRILRGSLIKDEMVVEE